MDTPDINEVTLGHAVELFQQGKHEDAQNLFLGLLNADPKNADALYFMSMIDHTSGRTEVAEHRARELLLEMPTDANALSLIGTILLSQHKFDEATTHFEKGIKYNADDPVLRVNSAICLIGQAKPEASIERCREAIHISPEYANAYNIMGNAYMALSNFKDASDSFRQAVEIEPDFTDAKYNLGKALFENGQYSESLTVIEDVLVVAPTLPHALCTKADILAYQTHYDDAASFYKQTLQVNKNFSPALIGLGKLELTHKRYNEALSFLKRAIELNPNSIEALMHIGDAFRQLNQPEAAAAAFNDILAIDPDNAQAKFHLGTVDNTAAPAKPDDDYIKRLFDEFADNFDESLNKVQYDAPKQLFELAIQQYDSTESHQLDILDLGCGTGLCGVLFKEIAGNLKGVDISPKMLETARMRGIYNELEENELLTALVRHQNDTDLIVSGDVFPYLGDLEGIFLAVTSALRNDGLFLFSAEAHQGEANYHLSSTARYSHSKKYLMELAKRRNLEMICCNETSYRKEAGKPVEGFIVALKKLP